MCKGTCICSDIYSHAIVKQMSSLLDSPRVQGLPTTEWYLLTLGIMERNILGISHEVRDPILRFIAAPLTISPSRTLFLYRYITFTLMFFIYVFHLIPQYFLFFLHITTIHTITLQSILTFFKKYLITLFKINRIFLKLSTNLIQFEIDVKTNVKRFNFSLYQRTFCVCIYVMSNFFILICLKVYSH